MFVVEGIYTSIPLHQRILAHPDFIAGKLDTGFLVSNGLNRRKEVAVSPTLSGDGSRNNDDTTVSLSNPHCSRRSIRPVGRRVRCTADTKRQAMGRIQSRRPKTISDEGWRTGVGRKKRPREFGSSVRPWRSRTASESGFSKVGRSISRQPPSGRLLDLTSEPAGSRLAG